MGDEMDKTTKKLIIILLSLAIAYLFFRIYPDIMMLLGFIFKIILPFLLGFSLAFILMPYVRFFQRRGLSHRLSVIVVLAITISFFVFLFVFTIPLIFNQIDKLIDNLPNIVTSLEDFLVKISEKLTFLPEEYIPTPAHIEAFVSDNLNHILEFGVSSLRAVFSYFSVILLTPVLTIYFLFDFEEIERYMRRYVNTNHYTTLRTFLVEMKHTMEAYFRGVFLVVLVISVACWMMFSAIGLDYSILMALIIGLTDVIPYIGPYLGGALAATYAFSISTNKAISVIIIVAIVQLVESNFLTPFIQSHRVKTHPILVVLSLTFFGATLGFFGLLIAVPVLAIVQTTIKFLLKKRVEASKPEIKI
jgi:predicted PurR-regulated permease PerM